LEKEAQKMKSTGKVVLFTGAPGDIGHETAKMLLVSGMI